MGNINSFSESVKDLIIQSNVSLENISKLQESMLNDNDTIQLNAVSKDPISGKEVSQEYSLPSFSKITNDIKSFKSTLDVFLNGKGDIKLYNNDYYVKVKPTGFPVAPNNIEYVKTPTTFNSSLNWFFEDLLFPKLSVKLDLTDYVESEAKQVLVKRILIDNTSSERVEWFKNNIFAKQLSYGDTLNIINSYNLKYWEDENIYNFPLTNIKYIGEFKILNKVILNNKIWYVIDEKTYALNETNPIYNIDLKIGDTLSYNNKAIFKINDIVINNENIKIQVESIFGYSEPNKNQYFKIHNTDLTEKSINVAIGYDELDVIFVKGINSEYNIVSSSWSSGISFYTNDLVLEDNTISLENYYYTYVSDFGKQLEGQVKEKYIPAYYGETPNAPSLTSSDFRVVQINTQFNSSLDTQSVVNTERQIVETKSQIDSLKTTIAKEKQNLINNTSSSADSSKNAIREKIKSYTDQLSVLSTEYSSLVNSLATLANESGIVETSPKYRIRGFFPIPELKYPNNDTSLPAQEIVQFEIAYRYLRLDNTGTALNTFSYTDINTGEEVSAVFSDWNIATTKHKEKYFNSTLNAYEWKNENISSGEEININQIDVSIQKGEKVELKIRSLSEAGWPSNPLKSEWSNSIIIDFPSNLETSSQVSFILKQAQEESTQIELQNTLASVGIIAHLDDTIPNLSNTSNSIYYKHLSENIAYVNNKGSNNEEVVSLQATIETLQTKIAALEKALNK